MTWNSLVRKTAKMVRPKRIGHRLGRLLLLPSAETHHNLFGKYIFRIDLSMGHLQRHFFLFPETYELETQQTLLKLLKPGMRVFDIGANTGFFTILMADLVGNRGEVHSFEPYQPNFDLLRDNIRLNSFHWAKPHSIALSHRKESAVLSINPINDGGHSLGDFTDNPDLIGWNIDELKVTVETNTLDNFIEENAIEHVDLIKIDVEGAETLVFSGGENMLSANNAPMIICEVGDVAQKQFGKTERDLREMLYSYGYRSYFLSQELTEFGIETPVKGLVNILFRK